MHLNHSTKLFLTVSIIIFLVIGFILPGSVLALRYNDDGIWTDSFQNASTILILNGTSNCVWDNGQIHLAKSSGVTRNYTFAGGGSVSHRAYWYVTALSLNGFFGFFFPPDKLSNPKYEFNTPFQYRPLEQLNESTNPEIRYATTTSSGFKKNVIQHFRFQLDGTPESIGNLHIKWYGNAVNAKSIEMYYWEYRNISILGNWKNINYTYLTGDQVFSYNMSVSQLEMALNSDNYIDICVVAYASTTPCSLNTDFVLLQSVNQEGYKVGYAHVQTKSAINLTTPVNQYWDLLTWDDYQSGGATIKFQVLYNYNSSNSSSYAPVDDSILAGNAQGFTSPPISLSSLTHYYYNIKLQANLSTSDPTVTPKLISWTVMWQTGNKWQDRFSSEYRIDVKNNVNVNNGSVNISLVSGDWPMFGQNPSNTRASSGSAAYTNDLYWWSSYHEYPQKKVPINMVLDGQSLYVTTNTKVYRYFTFLVPADKTGYEYTDIYPYYIDTFWNLYDREFFGSPAISGQYLVIATGNESNKNYVYAFTKDQPDNDPIWTFDYSKYNPNEPYICYWGSPIIADGLVYLTSWSGDASRTGYHINNMILALDLATGKEIWKYTFPPSSTPARSPTWSFSTPAYSNGKVVAGCMNDLSGNLFAFDALNGTLLWNTSVGAIGKAAPVIYNGTVYVVSENNTVGGILKKTMTMLTAVSLDDGTIQWQALLGKKKFATPLNSTYSYAQTTPVVANGILYVVSPDWYITAFDLSKTDTVLWSTELPGRSISSPILTLSPSFADGILYVGTPNGVLWALNTALEGAALWNYTTYSSSPTRPAIVTDPIVSNGLIYFADENGRLYVCGAYVEPNEQINGSIISVPIQLPTGFWWNKFYALIATNKSTSMNWIRFSLLDANKNYLKTLTNTSALILSNGTLGRTIRLQADFWAMNGSENPNLFLWNVTFISDTVPPFINRSSLNPNPNSNSWLNVVIPQFTVNVQDNVTGLLVNSAQYRLEYDIQNVTYYTTQKALCTGTNGTTQVQQLTMNLSKLDFYKNITALHGLQINISDLAGNLASLSVPFKQDTQKPSSHILAQSMKKRYNASTPFIWINATAYDNGTDASGIDNVKLYYRYSSTGNFSGDWILFANSSISTPHWMFGFANNPSQHGGYFELTTIATDIAGNMEDFPAAGDVSFLYDWTIPDLPTLSGETLWFRQQPQFSATFTDDFRLDTVQYRSNFDTTWTTIASKINSSSYLANWQLNDADWNQMQSGEEYYLYFNINDTLGNTRLVIDNNQALIIRKDTEKPNVTIDIPTEENQLITTGNFTISAFADDFNGSGISEVALYYQYSKDNSNWTEWVHFDDNLTAAPFEWTFDTPKGDGYYKFQITAVDFAGNEAQSTVVSSGVIRLPIDMVLVMIALVIVLLLIGAVLYRIWRKRK